MISAVLAFGMIFQQVVFPALSRNWRASSDAGRRLLDFAVRMLMSGFIPVAVGGALLADPLVKFLLPSGFHHSALLLAVGIWKAPLLSLAFLYQATLIAMNRESQGMRLLLWGSIFSAPLIAVFHWRLGLPGAAMAVLVIGLGLVAAGYSCLWDCRCRPPVHHHVARPAVASVFMIPACLLGLQVHVVVAVLAGALTYLLTMNLIGGLDFQIVGDGGVRASGDVAARPAGVRYRGRRAACGADRTVPSDPKMVRGGERPAEGGRT
jgi:O-antigen/teichoic acid export membrane protein